MQALKIVGASDGVALEYRVGESAARRETRENDFDQITVVWTLVAYIYKDTYGKVL